ncbi:hypothetical protein Ancab_014686 [Ancistrocladus abbreviatus]
MLLGRAQAQIKTDLNLSRPHKSGVFSLFVNVCLFTFQKLQLPLSAGWVFSLSLSLTNSKFSHNSNPETMESVANISLKQLPFHLSFNQYNCSSLSRPISTISLKTPFSSLSLSSLSIKMQSSSGSRSLLSNPENPKPCKSVNPLSALSLLKTPFCIAVAAAALFFSRFSQKPLLALAVPISTAPAMETTANDGVSEEEREKALEEDVASNPDDLQALKALMEAKIKNKKLQEAIDVATRLIEVEPNEVEWQVLKAHMYTYTGETELAKMGFEEILDKDPLCPQAYHGLVMAVSQSESEGNELGEVLKRIEGAMEKCKKEKWTDTVRDFKLLIAQVRVIEGKYMEALKIYQELVREDDSDFRPYLCQGIVYTLLGKKDEAEKQMEKYKKLVPKEHPYARYFDDNLLATKVFSHMAENQKMETGAEN